MKCDTEKEETLEQEACFFLFLSFFFIFEQERIALG